MRVSLQGLRGFVAFGVVLLLTGLLQVRDPGLSAQDRTPVALTGVVSSSDEGNMEGVVVSARRDGANFTVSVVSDAQGRYSFPQTHVEPGSYDITTRAVGYDLRSPGPVEVTADASASVDLQLRVTTDLASQLTSAEWAYSMPGTKAQKDELVYQLMSCAYCHTFERIMKSRHSAEAFMPVIQRMGSYFPDGAASSRDGRGRAVRNSPEAQERFADTPDWGFVPGISKVELASFLAMANLSDGKTTWPYELKTLPRPTGKATRVIVTQYDMPRKDTVPHDMDLDSQGRPWYADQSAQFIGVLDPKTATFTEYPLPPVPQGAVPGAWDIQVDQDDNVWFPMTTSTGAARVLTRFDPETETLTTVEGVSTQFLAMSSGDGKIWAGTTRVNPKTMTIDAKVSYQDASHVPPGSGGYQYVADSKGSIWIATYRGPGGVIGIDDETSEVQWFPIPGLRGRRGRIDQQDRYWFAEYLTDKIGMFDTRSGTHQRWDLREYSTPYSASAPDVYGRVYAGSNMTERLISLDSNTGEIIEYLMPTDFDTKKILFDSTTDRVTLWMANTRNARLVKVEPLD